MKLVRHIAVALALLLVFPGSLDAALKLTTDTNTVSFAFATTDFNAASGAAQLILPAAQTLTILSDKKTFTLTVRTLTSTFTFAPSGTDLNPNKAVSNLAVRAPNFSSSWLALSTTAVTFLTGPKSKANQVFPLDYRLDANLSSDPPGTYTVTLIYTLTNP